MPKAKKKATRKAAPKPFHGVRPIWSGTITFGLVSIPVDLLSAVRPRQTALKLVDKEGHSIGRQYICSKERKALQNADLVRGYETEDGKMVVITDQEFESVAPEMSADIRLKNFVPADQIPPVYFQKSYFLAPGGKSATAYNLLAATMTRTGRAGIGSFVMRGHEYLVAIVSDHGVLRADTLRYADEIRSPADIGLPPRAKPDAKMVKQFVKDIEGLEREELGMAELEDKEAEALQGIVTQKKKDSDNVIRQPDLESEDAEAPAQSAQVIDLMQVLRRSLSKRVVVSSPGASEPVSLDERRALKQAAEQKATKKTAKKKSGGRSRKPG